MKSRPFILALAIAVPIGLKYWFDLARSAYSISAYGGAIATQQAFTSFLGGSAGVAAFVALAIALLPDGRAPLWGRRVAAVLAAIVIGGCAAVMLIMRSTEITTVFFYASVLAGVAAWIGLRRRSQKTGALLIGCVALLSLAGAIAGGLMIHGSWDREAGWNTQMAPFFAGLYLFLTYFIANLWTALAILPIRWMWRLRYALHFGLFPLALCAWVGLGFQSYPAEALFVVFGVAGMFLILGLPYIWLCFQMSKWRWNSDREKKLTDPAANDPVQEPATPIS
jgi:hypothetical protein